MIVLTGRTGFLGSALCRLFDNLGIFHADYTGDLMDRVDDGQFQQGDVVVHCAYPTTGGIGSMETRPADIITDGLIIDINLIEACARRKVSHLICFGSVCSYPESTTFPTGEDQFWAGYPETVNAPYGIAKRMQLELLKAYRRQYDLRSSHLILGNLYGPGDRSGHVIPSTIRKVLKAQEDGETVIEVWGDGSASRDFLYVDDATTAVRNAILAGPPDEVEMLNLCSGREVRIEEMVTAVMALCGFNGSIRWNGDKPTGQPRRRFDPSKAAERLDWVARTPFEDGLRRTLHWMREQQHG